MLNDFQLKCYWQDFILPDREYCPLDKFQGYIQAPCLTCNQDDYNDDSDDDA